MRTVLALSTGLLVFALACGGGSDAPPSTPAAPTPSATTAAPPPPPPPPAPPAVTPAAPTLLKCCSNERLQQMVKNYLEAAVLLYKDDRGASAELSTVRGKSMAVLKDGSTDAVTNAQLQIIIDEAAAAMGSTPIEAIRKHFKTISDAVVTVVKRNAGGTLTLREANCPMYPGSWLQEAATIQNPYYGPKMPTCGSFK